MSRTKPRASNESMGPLAESWTPSNRLIWTLVAVIALLGIALVALEAGLDDEQVPNFISSAEGETSPEEIAYANQVGVAPEQIQLDITAVEELHGLGINPCSPDSEPVPANLASRVPAECLPFDGHGGIGYPLVATALAALGALIMHRWHNRLGLYLLLAVLFDMIGAVVGAYALRALVIRPDTLQGGYIVAFLGSVSWIMFLVILVPRMILTFPTGRLVSPWWRWVVRATYVAAGILAVTQLLHPFLMGPIPNPIRAGWSVTTANTFFDLGTQLWLLTVVAALISVLVRALRWSRRAVRNRRRSRDASDGSPASSSSDIPGPVDTAVSRDSGRTS